MRRRGAHFADGTRPRDLHQLRLQLFDARARSQRLGEVVKRTDEKCRFGIVAQFAHRQAEWNRRTVLAPARHIAALSDDLRLARPKIVPDVRVVIPPVPRGHEQVDVVAKHFVRGIPEQPFASGVVEQNRPGRIDYDDAVERGVDDPTKLVLAEDER